MASLKDLRDRIASVRATQKITRAMQMVAAAKLRRSQEAVLGARPYSQRIALILDSIATSVSADNVPCLMSGTGSNHVHLVVVCTSERGLCGAFNSQISRFAADFIRTCMAERKIVKIVTVGKKGNDILRREFDGLIIDHINLRETGIGFTHAKAISRKIIARFNAGEFDICTLFYSEFESVISQNPVARQLVPLSSDLVEGESTRRASTAVYEYEPDSAAILDTLVPQNISVQIFRALLENVAGEMGARMSAMDNATRNAGEMINKLSITYNRQRQAQITTELIEIIAGAEAL